MNKPGYRIEKFAERIGLTVQRLENGNLKIIITEQEEKWPFDAYVLVNNIDDEAEACDITTYVYGNKKPQWDDNDDITDENMTYEEVCNCLKYFLKQVNKCKKLEGYYLKF